jgi:hypothetical protein
MIKAIDGHNSFPGMAVYRGRHTPKQNPSTN